MDACPIPQAAEPCALVIFGASGDLTKRKLVPSLYNLASYHLLPADFSIIGVARRPLTDEVFRDQLGKDLAELGTQPVDPNLWGRFRGRISYCGGNFDDPATYKKLAEALAESEKNLKTSGNVVFYLSVQPDYFATIARQLSEAGLVAEENGRWRRVIIEKPFGHDLASARELNAKLTSVLQEHQIYRIDHYLGKETAQNLLVFRLGNAIFEPIWNRRYIDHVQLTVAESIGVEGRGAFYETAGAFRDVMQNHMFMLLALIAMEPPTSLEGEAIRNEKVKLLRSIRRTTPEEALWNTVRGQYGEGVVGGKKLTAYRQEPNVNPDSRVETFAAIKLMIENWRWAGVPFYLRSGKRLPRRTTQIVFRFKTPPLSLFATNEADPIAPNYLIFSIQPEEGITIQVRAKIPGPTICTRSVRLEFDYDQFGDLQPTTGYEKLLYDCMVGDTSLFHRSDMVEAAWEAASPILEAWNNNPVEDFPNYASGTWGPEAATKLIERDNHHWWSAENH
ncbi:MAG: glucose-6-phosphate dehydrogenase [Verrucomicrobia bacterium]|nr:glucose-6-phosphate dehydrogenase [Verrucomicrobiota bacterium]MBV8417164.1 glucose-6-phosphate dehydrogenase [Verrucomicrobiota bacterium]